MPPDYCGETTATAPRQRLSLTTELRAKRKRFTLYISRALRGRFSFLFAPLSFVIFLCRSFRFRCFFSAGIPDCLLVIFISRSFFSAKRATLFAYSLCMPLSTNSSLMLLFPSLLLNLPFSRLLLLQTLAVFPLPLALSTLYPSSHCLQALPSPLPQANALSLLHP